MHKLELDTCTLLSMDYLPAFHVKSEENVAYWISTSVSLSMWDITINESHCDLPNDFGDQTSLSSMEGRNNT